MAKTTQNSSLVSVIITVYNAERFVREAVLSIAKQTYKNIEIIIVNDGSKDQTGAILKSLKKLDSRIKVVNLRKNLGPSLASNIGLKFAKGNYIARMDADDISLPDRIEKQLTFLINNPNVVIVGGNSYLINELGKIIGKKDYPTKHKEIYNSLFTMNSIQHPNCMINKKLLPRIYYHNHSLLAHDLELFFEASQYGELANLSDITLYYRQSKNSLSFRNPKATFNATVNIRIKAIKKYNYHPTFKALLVHYLQIMIIMCIPNKLIYPLFKFIRIDRHSVLKNLSLAFLQKFVITSYPYKLLRAA